jgi:fumarate reductase flavoprotein subunit
VNDVLFPVDRIRDAMWNEVGLFRDAATLERAVESFEEPWRTLQRHLAANGRLDVEQWRAANLLTVARLIARAALRREESRGAHYRDDHPKRDDINWQHRVAETIDNGE